MLLSSQFVQVKWEMAPFSLETGGKISTAFPVCFGIVLVPKGHNILGTKIVGGGLGIGV